MNTTLLLDCFLDERRLAIIENGITQYFHLFTTAYTHTHQIYLGRVIDINTQLNAVFIDLGNGQSGLLQARSARSLPLLKSQTAHGPEKRSDLIEDYVHQGQAILVQVLRAGHNKKGPKLTTSITLTHPLMMYHPLGRSISIPKRLENEDRQRLKTFADNTLNGEMGLSFRWRRAAARCGMRQRRGPGGRARVDAGRSTDRRGSPGPSLMTRGRGRAQARRTVSVDPVGRNADPRTDWSRAHASARDPSSAWLASRVGGAQRARRGPRAGPRAPS